MSTNTFTCLSIQLKRDWFCKQEIERATKISKQSNRKKERKAKHK